MGERLDRTQEVRGSIPLGSTSISPRRHCTPVSVQRDIDSALKGVAVIVTGAHAVPTGRSAWILEIALSEWKGSVTRRSGMGRKVTLPSADLLVTEYQRHLDPYTFAVVPDGQQNAVRGLRSHRRVIAI
ncbi:protein of unknown function [Candidatus Filomicrobium marinum]|uniref:Uncharacterized protein n=1 Tax=Candidatus Filomicrobium marinum TaxID=1608628 RepID=A0A0D6JBZ4_9HYPH|nr:protein of unknown function [Candidatus Filomicrobium marinum]CPR16476.1 protein of unknown function [Candidatus Filomicrobium marinum]